MVPDFMSQAPRPYILPSFTTGENGGVSHISSGPAGTTSRYPCRISDLPALVAGRYVPTTVRALEKSCSIGPKPPKSLRSLTSISQSSTSYPRRRKRSPIISWHGPSAPRVEGIATKSRVVASCASKLASTASRIFCLVSMAFIALLFLLSLSESRARQYTPHSNTASHGDTDARQPQYSVSHHGRADRRGWRARLQSLPDQEATGRPADQCRPERAEDREQVRQAASKVTRGLQVRRFLIPLLGGFALAALAASAMADQVSREQDIVDLRLGQRIQVDDGSCPAGQIKEVSGARMTATGILRAQKCIPRLGPKKR